MADCSVGKESVETCVKALTEYVCINPGQLRFTWEESDETAAAGAERRPGDRVEIVRVFLGRNWSTLYFAESEIGNPDRLSERLAKRKGDILEALKRLKILESLDRWEAGGDVFRRKPA
ncbi:MAG TPA: hypothetical protein VL354_06185 [Spirochaetia bacterium]|nr:hypothetical protein [Spirochaetia bacterium]